MEALKFYGVDASRKTVSVACYGSDEVLELGNDVKSLKDWLGRLPKSSKVAVESTGKEHQRLAELAYAAGVEVYVLNARLIKRYREAMGLRAKTDRCDALLIARYLAKEHRELHLWRPMTGDLACLHKLLRRRREAVETRTALQQSFGDCPEVQTQFQGVMDSLETLVKTLDAHLTATVNACDERRARIRLLQSVPGIGAVIAPALLVALEHYTFVSDDAFIAYLGLDPRPRDSGTLRGRRHLSRRGDAFLRSLMYMAALTGRRSASCKPYYERQLAKGLKAVQALIVLARKLARVAFAIHASGQKFDPSRLQLA